MIEWLLSGVGAFVKLVKIWLIIFSYVFVLGFAAIVTDYWCKIYKRWLYRKRRQDEH